MEYYKIAAKWWADQIRNVGLSSFDNGDQSSTGGMAMAMDSNHTKKITSHSIIFDV